ncbi:MAG: ATPase, partial [Paenibacillus macerans]|nr:ATPase [Paenibacillus macerans]
LDAIKAYRAKEAELQAEKVQALFTTLQIRLFKFVKTTGEYESDFSIQMSGKDYATLSTGEKIAAGLELTEVLHKQSGLIVPTFIDGIGEYTGEVAVYGQLITGRAVKGQKLKIETEDLSK